MEFLYAYDFFLSGESLDEVMGKYARWKIVLKGKVLNVNVEKTKGMLEKTKGMQLFYDKKEDLES